MDCGDENDENQGAAHKSRTQPYTHTPALEIILDHIETWSQTWVSLWWMWERRECHDIHASKC